MGTFFCTNQFPMAFCSVGTATWDLLSELRKKRKDPEVAQQLLGDMENLLQDQFVQSSILQRLTSDGLSDKVIAPEYLVGDSRCRTWLRRILWPHVRPQTVSEYTETVGTRALKSNCIYPCFMAYLRFSILALKVSHPPLIYKSQSRDSLLDAC